VRWKEKFAEFCRKYGGRVVEVPNAVYCLLKPENIKRDVFGFQEDLNGVSKDILGDWLISVHKTPTAILVDVSDSTGEKQARLIVDDEDAEGIRLFRDSDKIDIAGKRGKKLGCAVIVGRKNVKARCSGALENDPKISSISVYMEK